MYSVCTYHTYQVHILKVLLFIVTNSPFPPQLSPKKVAKNDVYAENIIASTQPPPDIPLYWMVMQVLHPFLFLSFSSSDF